MNLDKTSRLMLGIVEAISANKADLLSTINNEASALAAAKDAANKARKEANDNVSPVLWTAVCELGASVTDAAGADQLDAGQLCDIFSALIVDAVKGGEPAVKSVKAYASTGKSCIRAVKAGALNWHQVRSKLVKEGDEMKEAPVTYREVRDLLKSDGQKELDAMAKKIGEAIAELRGRENDVRSVESRKADLQSVLDIVSPIAERIRNAREQAKPANKRAAAVNSIKQQQPTGPMTTEVVSKPQVIAA